MAFQHGMSFLHGHGGGGLLIGDGLVWSWKRGSPEVFGGSIGQLLPLSRGITVTSCFGLQESMEREREGGGGREGEGEGGKEREKEKGRRRRRRELSPAVFGIGS